MMNGIIIEKGYQGFKKLAEHWPADKSDYFFNQYDWVISTVNSRGNGELISVCVYDHDRLSAVIPMQLYQEKTLGINFKCLGFIEPDHLYIHGLIGSTKRQSRIGFKQLMAALNDSGVHVSCLNFKRLYDYKLLDLIDLSDAFHLKLTEGRSNIIDCGDGYDAYLSGLSANRRQGLRKKRKRLERLGNVSVFTSEDESCVAFLERYLLLEKRGWKGEAGNAILNTESQTTYYRDIVCHDSTVIQILTLNDVDVAAQVMVSSVDTLFVFKTSFESEYSKYSPGELLLLEAVKYAEENNLQHVNLITDLQWHHHLSNAYRELHSYKAYDLSLKSMLLKLAHMLKKSRDSYRKKVSE